MSIDKYVGCIVKIVYIDRHNKISERNIEVKVVRDGYIRARCLAANGPRVFAVNNVLAYELVRHHAS